MRQLLIRLLREFSLQKIFFALAFLFLLAVPVFSYQGQWNWHILKSSPQIIPEDLYLMGWNVEVSSPIQGDLFVLGGKVRVRGAVHGNVFLAGGSVRMEGPVDGDVTMLSVSAVSRSRCRTSRILAVSAKQKGNVKKDALTCGLLSRSEGDVGGDTVLAGENVELQGKHEGKLFVFAHHAEINGEIHGDSEIRANRISLGLKALFFRNLTYVSSTDLSGEQKRIRGQLAHTFSSFFHVPREFRFPWVYTVAHRVVSSIWLTIVGFVILTWFPRSVRTVVNTMLHFPWESFGLGLLLFLALPSIAFLLLVSLLGMPLGIFLFILFGVGIYLTRLFGSLYIGERLLGALEHHVPPYWQSLPLGVFLFTVLTSIPWFGILVSFVVIPLALGAKALLGRRVYRRMRSRHLA